MSISSPSKRKRLRTLGRLIYAAVNTALVLIALFWLLKLVGADPSSILASAGIVGLAVGFGAQTLVRDFLSGMFIILENQFGIGDQIRVNGQEGTVEGLSIRLTVLKDKDGNRIYIPNGTISTVINLNPSPEPPPGS